MGKEGRTPIYYTQWLANRKLEPFPILTAKEAKVHNLEALFACDGDFEPVQNRWGDP